MIVWTTPAFRARLHRFDNRYRWSGVRSEWQYDDGVGPWTPSGMLAGKNREQGEEVLRTMNYQPEIGNECQNQNPV